MKGSAILDLGTTRRRIMIPIVSVTTKHLLIPHWLATSLSPDITYYIIHFFEFKE
jgi:hypothetical protein